MIGIAEVNTIPCLGDRLLNQIMILDLLPSAKYKKKEAMLKINSLIWKEVRSSQPAKAQPLIVMTTL